MAAPARLFTNSSRYGPYAGHVEDDDAYDDPLSELDPGERIGRPLANARRKFILNAAVVGMLAIGGGWAWFNHRETVLEWTGMVMAAVSPLLERKLPVPPTAAPSPPELQPVAAADPPAALPSPAMPAMSPATMATLSPATADPEQAPAAPPVEILPPPVADPADPFQAKALAVGLHPGVSRVLLSKLSATDFRNAGIAIKTALAETPDANVFVWPRQRTPELALFQVKFVPGALTNCRRYVVMVTKDGWLTTAPPMEKCSIHAKDARK